MLENRIRVLIVEDEAVLALDLGEMLEKEGYHLAGIAHNGRRALELFREQPVDLVLCDVQIRGDWDGIETVGRLLAIRSVPVIYLTAFSDKETLERAKLTQPAAYLVKPVNPVNLQISIDLALQRFNLGAARERLPEKDTFSREAILRIEDSIFIKHNYQFMRIEVEDILFLEADNAYTTIVTSDKKYAIRMTLSMALNRLGIIKLVRIHRSFVVNVRKIRGFNDREVYIEGYTLPMGKQFKEDFMRIFQIQ
ncbi:MAG: response regulator [Siphonobacter aquaeclarae]|nr:response regulator [Siphonobacter aquaeclarae]